MINDENNEILTVICRKGQNHDFRIFKEHEIEIEPAIEILADSGYRGIQKIHPNSRTPIRKRKHKNRTEEEKTYNRELSRERIKIEHINRQCKIFRIVQTTYRGKRRNIQCLWNVICGLVNFKNKKLRKVQII